MTDKLKLLIVEDDKSLLDLYNVAIPDKVFEKRLINTASAALKVYEEWKPDILLLDIMLPDRSGFSVLEDIRLARKDSTTAIVMSTSLDRKSDIDKCHDLNIQGYIVKPFDYKVIAREIIEFYSTDNPEKAKDAMAVLDGD